MAAAWAGSVTTRWSSAPASATTRTARAAELVGVVADELDDQPALPARQVGDDRGGDVAHPLDDAGVQPLAGGGPVRQDARCRVGGVGHRGVAEHDEAPLEGSAHQPHGGAQDEGERALAADQRPGHVEAALGQQVLEGVAGHLAPEPAELGADRAEVGVDDAAQPASRRRLRGAALPAAGPSRSRAPEPVTTSRPTTLSDVRP